MTIQCETTPTTVATGLTLHIVPKGTPSSTNPSDMTGDPFCSDGAYSPNTSECESGEWKWGSFTVKLPDIATPPRLMSEISSMQEMTPEFCASVTMDSPGNTARLKDERDGKYYWVAKLADGNCWMTQNLELDLSGRTLTPEDSDVGGSWYTDSRGFDVFYQGTADSTEVQFWTHAGGYEQFILQDPDSTESCSPSATLSENSCDGISMLVSITMTPMTEYRTDGVVYDLETKTYDAHYLVGNYYSYAAATAGSGAELTSYVRAPDSICPKGFELPTSYRTYDLTPGSFYNLLSEYGFVDTTGSGEKSITRAPLFLTRAGVIAGNGGALQRIGDYGGYWSSVNNSLDYAYSLHFYSNITIPSAYDYFNRYSGYQVRCVAIGN